MKVPPPHNLIVCAIPPQTIVRHFVLAAVAYVSVLCGAARAQSVPAAPPLLLGGAVELSYTVESYTTAALESSANLTLWQPATAAEYGDGEEIIRYVAAPADKAYFRLRIDTLSTVGKSRWELSGARLLRNTATGMEILVFSESGTGTMESVTGTGSFTWTWERTGADTGSAVITWPNGIVETMDLQFTAGNAGVFTSERSREGIPAGTVTGTFRDDPAAVLLVSMPPASESKAITLSGTGRPVRINVDGTGNASISSPAGGTSFTADYTVTGNNTAELFLICQDGSTQRCGLQFTGPSCGSYTLQAEANGSLRRTAAGTFTISPH